MKVKQLWLVSLIIIIISCQKGSVNNPEPPLGSSDVRVKDINERNLPSPYYHFEYNDSGNISRANYSAGLRTYKVQYDGNSISSMEHAIDPRNIILLEYVYNNNGDPLAVRVKDRNGVTTRHCVFSFSTSHQLQEIDWDVREGDVGYALEQTMTFSYYPDGNVMEITTHNYAVGSQTEATYTDRFDNYDDHVNVDGFSLLHTNSHELVLLPGIKIQVNNPGRNIHTGDGINYEVNYTYTYDAKGRPIVKTGDLVFTNGTDAGQHFEIQSTFSYYD